MEVASSHAFWHSSAAEPGTLDAPHDGRLMASELCTSPRKLYYPSAAKNTEAVNKVQLPSAHV